MKTFVLLFSLLLAGTGLFAQTKEAAPFTTAAEVNLLELLPPPPSGDSAVTKAELDALVALQAARSPAQSERAVADDEESVWRFADAVGNPGFTKEKLPVFSAFFGRLVATEPAVVDPAKDSWKRPRPYLADSRLNPLLKKKTSGAYPSGHATIGTLMGIVLSNMLPELRGPLMERAAEFAANRLVAGMHYASDIDAGKRSATAIAAVIRTKADYAEQIAAAKAELRAALGYK